MEFPPENIKDRVEKFFDRENIRDNPIIKIAIGCILVTFGIFIFPHPESIEYRYNTGAVWVDKDLVAPFAFPIYKDIHDYEREQQEAVRSVYPVFVRRDTAVKTFTGSLRATIRLLAAGTETKSKKNHISPDSLNRSQITPALPFVLSNAEWNFLSKQRDARKKGSVDIFRKYEQNLVTMISEILRSGMIDRPKTKQAHTFIAIRLRTVEELTPSENIFDTEEAISIITSRLSTVYSDNMEVSIGLEIARSVLTPNLMFDQSATNIATQNAIDNVPRTIGFVSENERIISKHDRITEEIKLKLDSFRRAKVERGTNSDNWKHWLGVLLHVAVILGLFALYLFIFRKKIFHSNGKLLLIGILLIIEMSFAYLSLMINSQEPLQYLIFVPVASLLLAIIFDTRVAFYGTVAIAFLIAGVRGNDYAITLSSIIAGTLGAYTVRDIQSRTQLFRSMIYIFLGYFISIAALSFEQLENIATVSTEVSFAFANAVISPVLAYGLLIFFERTFKVTTDLTLVELSDFNHPLLKELSEIAPGTFHHSVTIGNLAEAAAEDIGANSILARVGGYYHDVGKTLKPEYFVENQVGPHSRHNRLKPRMSALIISSHVREGIGLAREKGLPEIVTDFIPQHHGTTRISFFFDKALRQAAKKPQKDALREEDFLYPGPKPQTKETGIVMLADSVEAATRTIAELTPQKLESAIDNMIKHRFLDGQLDECELTLRDLTKIKEAFLKILLGIHHHRIEYPEPVSENTIQSTSTVRESTQEPAPEVQPQDNYDDVFIPPPVSETSSDVNPKTEQSQEHANEQPLSRQS